MDDDTKKDDGNIIKEKDNIKEPYIKKPGRITAGKKLSEFNRLKKLDMKKNEYKINYYYIGVPIGILFLYFMFRKSDNKKYTAEKYVEPKIETKKSEHEVIIEI